MLELFVVELLFDDLSFEIVLFQPQFINDFQPFAHSLEDLFGVGLQTQVRHHCDPFLKFADLLVLLRECQFQVVDFLLQKAVLDVLGSGHFLVNFKRRFGACWFD